MKDVCPSSKSSCIAVYIIAFLNIYKKQGKRPDKKRGINYPFPIEILREICYTYNSTFRRKKCWK